MFNLKPEDRQFVHDHMVHSGKTAQVKYMRPVAVKRSTVPFWTMQKNLRGEAPPPSKKDENESPKKRKREESESEEEGILSTLSTNQTLSTKNITLTDEDMARLRTFFKEKIETNKKMSEFMIRDKLRNETHLRYTLDDRKFSPQRTTPIRHCFMAWGFF